jgi:hypothetical protein
VEMLNNVGERERPNLVFARDVGHAVSAQHSFHEARPDPPVAVTWVLYIAGEQVSRTVRTLCFQVVSRGPQGSWHAAVSARSILAYFHVAPSNEDWEEVQPRSVTEDCSACR